MTNQAERELPEIPYFPEIVGYESYPWQRCFYDELVGGKIREAVDIPTGLGKTLCVLLLLLARLRNRALPTRVVYVVDRRAIVDQTAAAIRTWIDRIASLPALSREFHACASFPAESPVGLGVLRGGLADDGGWRVDPARPTVIVGTVDMVGSRILFSGYGDGRSRRPMHAGLLGHDAVVMLDEAHLSPAMGELLRAVSRLQNRPEFRATTLSATSVATGTPLRLSRKDRETAAVRCRLFARKAARFQPVARRADRVPTICKVAAAHQTGAIAVFVQSVVDAERIATRLTRELGTDGAVRVALLTGTLRGEERSALAEGMVWQRFQPGSDRNEASPSVYLVSTAAGEVGVDLDADHAVMDLGPLDSMIQRMGRVNRAGSGDATVTIVYEESEGQPPDGAPKTFRDKLRAARQRTLEVLRSLPDLSPNTLCYLDDGTLEACTVASAQPARLDATVAEAFAATSARLQLPPVAVYLRGVAEEPDLPETFLAWRRETAELVELGAETAKEVVSFYRPRPEEIARVPASLAQRLVQEALVRQEGRGLPLIVLSSGNDVWAAVIRERSDVPTLDFATVILPTTAGGLSAAGLPDVNAAGTVVDVADGDDRIRYAVPTSGDETAENDRELPAWVDHAIELRVPIPGGDDDDIEERFLVYALNRPDPALQTGESDLTWLGASTQTIDEHCARVGTAARRIGTALELPAPVVAALEAAGRWHDRGKARAVWQRAAGVPPDGPLLAKSTKGRFRPEWLGGYRHEFGSLADAERGLPANLVHRELVLHLIAAHHGWARPGFPRQEHWDPDDSSRSNRARAVRTATRFARLQAHEGPWHLAWLEALVKAADAWVSSEAGG